MININKIKNIKLLSHPPLSAESLTGSGFWQFDLPFFEGKKQQHNKSNVMLNLFQHLIFVKLRNKEIPKPVRNDKLYNASHCKSKCAFTLAEVLITLVIIGVIAALTIPNLMQKYTEQTTVKKVQKFYSNLSNAYSLAAKDNGFPSEWGLTGYSSDGVEKLYEILFNPYFKIAKNCGINNTGKCIVSTCYKALNNQIGDSSCFGNASTHYKLTLEDGSAIIFYIGSNNKTLLLFYDINGQKEPNQWGKDLFGFITINKETKIIPMGLADSTYPFDTYCKINNSNSLSGRGCAAWIVYKGNMDYLHCDLTWDKHSCKD